MEETTFMSHGSCYLWISELIWTHVISNAITVLAYAMIPVALIIVARVRKDVEIPTSHKFLIFGMFISCGFSHALNIVTIWHPVYYLTAAVHAMTGAISLGVTILLWSLIPSIIKIPSIAQLQRVNDELAEEIALKETTQEALEQKSDSMEELALRLTESFDHAEASKQQLRKYLEIVTRDIEVPVDTIEQEIEKVVRLIDTSNMEEAKDTLAGVKMRARLVLKTMTELSNRASLEEWEPNIERTSVEEILLAVECELYASLEESGGKVVRMGDPLPECDVDKVGLGLVVQNFLSVVLDAHNGQTKNPLITVTCAAEGFCEEFGAPCWTFLFEDRTSCPNSADYTSFNGSLNESMIKMMGGHFNFGLTDGNKAVMTIRVPYANWIEA